MWLTSSRADVLASASCPSSAAQEARDRDRREQGDDDHDDQHLDQREALLAARICTTNGHAYLVGRDERLCDHGARQWTSDLARCATIVRVATARPAPDPAGGPDPCDRRRGAAQRDDGKAARARACRRSLRRSRAANPGGVEAGVVTATLPADRVVHAKVGERSSCASTSQAADIARIIELAVRAPVGPGITGPIRFARWSRAGSPSTWTWPGRSSATSTSPATRARDEPRPSSEVAGSSSPRRAACASCPGIVIPLPSHHGHGTSCCVPPEPEISVPLPRHGAHGSGGALSSASSVASARPSRRHHRASPVGIARAGRW